MTIEVADSFTEASSDTALGSHTPDTGGGTWGFTSGNWQVKQATDVVQTDVRDHAWLSNTASSNNTYCRAVGATVSALASRYFGPCVNHTGFARGNASCNAYLLKLAGNGSLILAKEVAGAETQLGSTYTVPSFAAATEYTIEVQADTDADAVSGLIGGAVQIGPITDSAISTAAKYAITMRNTEPYITSMEGGTLSAGGVDGAIAVTLGAFVSSMAGTTTVVGSITNTLGSFVSSFAGTTTIIGSITNTLGSFVSSFAGTTTVQGAITSVLGAFTSAMQGTTTVVGAIGATLGAFFSNFVDTPVGGAASRAARRMLMFFSRRDS